MSVRWDNDPYLFRDPHQGWPAGPNGYTDLIDGLLDSPLISVRTNVDVTLENLERHLRELKPTWWFSPVHWTCSPVSVSASWNGAASSFAMCTFAHVDYAQGAMVVNYPGLEYPFIRIHDTKHASGQQVSGTVLGFEFPGAPTRYYPIELPRNRTLNDRYQNFLREEIGTERTFFAGRLANYVYIDMDDCMRQALDTAARILEHYSPAGAR